MHPERGHPAPCGRSSFCRQALEPWEESSSRAHGDIWASGGLRLGTHHQRGRLRFPLCLLLLWPERRRLLGCCPCRSLREKEQKVEDAVPEGGKGGWPQAGRGLPPKPGAPGALPLPEPLLPRPPGRHGGRRHTWPVPSGDVPLQSGPASLSGQKREPKGRRWGRGPGAAQTLPAGWADTAAIHAFIAVEWKQNGQRKDLEP